MIFGRCVKPCARPWILEKKVINPEQMVQIRISMATCGIAAGAKEIMNYFIEALDREKVRVHW